MSANNGALCWPIMRALQSESMQSMQTGAAKLRVMTWNVLAQCLIRREMFPYAEKAALKWSHRARLLAQRISDADADIMCLQEADDRAGFWDSTLTPLGYQHVFEAKTMRLAGPAADTAAPGVKLAQHGCLVAWKTQHFVLERHMRVDLDTGVVSEAQGVCTPSPPILTGCTALIACVKHIESGIKILVAVPHCYWRPTATLLRLHQMGNLFHALEQLNSNVSDAVVLCCGDFNCEPHDPEYRIITAKTVQEAVEIAQGENVAKLFESLRDDSHFVVKKSECESLSEAGARIAARLADCKVQVSRSLYSGYSELDAEHEEGASERNGEPKWTNYTEGFSGTLDYIFFCRDKRCSSAPESYFALSSIAMLPRKEDVAGWLPSLTQPSDHVPLLVDISMRKPNRSS